VPEVLAAVADGARRPQLLDVAAALASLMRARVRELAVRGQGPERASQEVLNALAAPEVLVGVVSADADPRAASWRIMRRAAKPLVLLPPDLRDGQPPIGRVLVPLDGSRECAHAVEHTVELCRRAGVDLVVLHVFNPRTAPPYWDQEAHALKAWGEEFLSRHVTAPGVRLEVRAGAPEENVVEVAEGLGADLIALGWSQRLDDGRAMTVRRSVLDAHVPVMLVPVTAQDIAERADDPPQGRWALPASGATRVS
jgi:nucleotide-binding universal stress UspA family protein